MTTRTKRSRKAYVCNLPVATALRVPCGPTARKEKWLLASYSCSDEKSMKRYRRRNGDKSRRTFGSSMPCELGLRQRMLKDFGGATCAARGILGSRKHTYNTFSLLLLSTWFE